MKYGLEVATGLDPDPIDPPNDPARLIYTLGPGGRVLVFGRNQDAPKGTVLKVNRSLTLKENNFQEIVRFSPSNNGTDIEGGNLIDNGPSIFSVNDFDPPTPKAFYRLEAVYEAP